MQKKIKISSAEKIVLLLVLAVLVITALLTRYYGSTDISDYSDTAKYFAGKYSADIRSSHSYLYGFIHAPFVALFGSFIAFKLTSIISLLLIIFSVYWMSGYSKKALLLMILSPIVWYMAPWINPIQISSLFFIWAYYFMKKYDCTEKLGYLACSGIFIGLGWAFWDTILFFGAFLGISFLFGKKFWHCLFFLTFLFIGLTPRLLFDTFFFSFPFYSIFKSTFGTLANIFGGIYQKGMFEMATAYSASGILAIVFVALSIPVGFWVLYKKEFLKTELKSLIFLSLSVALIAINPQIRYTLVVVPIMILLISKVIIKKLFKTQVIMSFAISLLFIAPYILQIEYSLQDKTVGVDISQIFENISAFHLSKTFYSNEINSDISQIVKDYPDEVFVVGNLPDYAQMLAHFYWGEKVGEFASIQDYNLWLDNQTVIFEKKFMPVPRISDRRQIWLAGGISVNSNDATDYSSITYAIGVDEPADIEGFKEIQNYSRLYLSAKQ